jgi:lipopolysaccharide/colanic/teichoic acid biosynthesis glycosyltransferase
MTIIPDFDRGVALPVRLTTIDCLRPAPVPVGGSPGYWLGKAALDVAGALLLLPLVAALALLLLLLNPVFNPGPLFYRQRRMGRDCTSFTALKFRTMRAGLRERGPSEPVEEDRITPLGRFLRRTGLDELPQAVNILRGEMSLIGPRPDCLHHAEAFLADIPEYRHRFRVRPGLSGLAQITLGYAVGTDATRVKARTDLDYIARASFALDARIAWWTLLTVLTGRGD